ncbi:MAG: hypothetical protein J5809_02485 [Selenomonadaceae bacterium]|nr:hypothetical protein [Selenomonadaceae bacterium]
MASEKISEVMNDEQLDAVSGGTNMESVSLLQRIQTERLAPVHTRIMPGNERAAAKELAEILKSYGFSGRLFMNDTQENVYTYNSEVVSADEVIDIMKKNQPTGVEV